MAPALDLLVLRTADVEAARRFYEALGLRWQEERHGLGPRHYSSRLGATLLELYPAKEGAAGRVRLSLRVTDPERAREAAVAAGGEPRPDGRPGAAIVVRDPDGNDVELLPPSGREGSSLEASPLMGRGDDAPFERRLAETIRWCAPRARIDDPAGSLRSARLRPRLLEVDRATVVTTVARYREAWGPRDVGTAGGLEGGRLLVYFPDADLADGAAEAESGGFFDVCNTPPWDTWIALLRDEDAEASFAEYVVCWVPPALVEAAARGMVVNPEECIAWLDESEAGALHALRARGILP